MGRKELGRGVSKNQERFFIIPLFGKKQKSARKMMGGGGVGGVGCLFIRRKSGPLGANEIDDVSSEGFKVNRSCESKIERKKIKNFFF